MARVAEKRPFLLKQLMVGGLWTMAGAISHKTQAISRE